VTAGRSDTRSANACSRRVVSGSLAAFLRDELKPELSREKTLITHARTQAAAFLGYEITVQHSRDRPNVNGGIRLRVPQAAIKAKCAAYLAHGQPERRTELMNLTDLLIISTYGAEYRGIVQYYLLAGDVWRLNRLEWVGTSARPAGDCGRCRQRRLPGTIAAWPSRCCWS